MTDTLIDQILTAPTSAVGVLVPAGMTPVAEYSALCDILVEVDPEASNDMSSDLEFEELSPADQIEEIKIAADYIDTAIWSLDNSLGFSQIEHPDGTNHGWQIISLPT